MKKKHCKTAAEFLACLRMRNPLWGGQPSWDWGFRGQGNADWPLLPSAFRAGIALSFADDSIVAPQRAWDDQHYYEYKLIQHFLFLADRIGLPVPGDAQHFRMPMATPVRWEQPDWPQDDVLETLATAQHHGVPTRLLDITHDSMTAAFFAADDARDPTKVGDAKRLGVWAVDLSLVRDAVSLGNGRLLHVTAPRASNSFLHHQDGLFLLDRAARDRREKLKRFQTLDEAVDEVFNWYASAATQGSRYYRPCPASPMILVTAPIGAAMDILDLLDREFCHRAALMPTHDNVVRTLNFERTLNAHRRKAGALAGIALGPKYDPAVAPAATGQRARRARLRAPLTAPERRRR